MSALVLAERPMRLWDDPGAQRAAAPAEAPRREESVGEGPTLADVLASAWEGLAARSAVACPVCHGELEPRPAGGRCRSCGTTLS